MADNCVFAPFRIMRSSLRVILWRSSRVIAFARCLLHRGASGPFWLKVSLADPNFCLPSASLGSGSGVRLWRYLVVKDYWL